MILLDKGELRGLCILNTIFISNSPNCNMHQFLPLLFCFSVSLFVEKNNWNLVEIKIQHCSYMSPWLMRAKALLKGKQTNIHETLINLSDTNTPGFSWRYSCSRPSALPPHTCRGWCRQFRPKNARGTEDAFGGSGGGGRGDEFWEVASVSEDKRKLGIMNHNEGNTTTTNNEGNTALDRQTTKYALLHWFRHVGRLGLKVFRLNWRVQSRYLRVWKSKIEEAEKLESPPPPHLEQTNSLLDILIRNVLGQSHASQRLCRQ